MFEKNQIMKKFLFLFSLTLVVISAQSQTSFYEHPEFPQRAKTHNVIAILPFDVSVNLRPKEMKDMTADQIATMAESESKGVQNALFSWFLKRKNQGRLELDVQPPQTTNAKLLREGITSEVLAAYEPSEICEILGVDAYISGAMATNKLMSQGTAVVMTLLVGASAGPQVTMTLNIYEGASNELMCNYQKKLTGSGFNTNQDMVNVLMRKASRRIAYTSSLGEDYED